MHRMTAITFLVGDDYLVVTPIEWAIESKWIQVEHGVKRDHYQVPQHLLEDEFAKARQHFGLAEGNHHIDTLIATKDRRIMQIVPVERRVREEPLCELAHEHKYV